MPSHTITMCAHAFMLCEIIAFKNQTSVHNSVFCSVPPTEYERKRVFSIPPSVGSFSSAGKSFCILQYLASSGFANPLSVHMMLFLHLSPPQYIAIIFLLLVEPESVLSWPFPILENIRLSELVLMIQTFTWFAGVNECITGEHKCDANANAVCNNTKGSFQCTCKPGYSGNGVNCTADYISVETWIVLMLRLFKYHLPRVHAFESVESKRDISPNVQIRVWILASSTKWSLS